MVLQVIASLQKIKNEASLHLFNFTAKLPTTCYTRQSSNGPSININHNVFKNCWQFSLTIIEWKKLDSNIRTSPSSTLFKKKILEFIRPHPNRIFNDPNSSGLTYFTRLSVALSPLLDQKFRHNFRYSLSPTYNFGKATELRKRYPLHCSHFMHETQSLLQNFEKINPHMISMNKSSPLTQLLLYGYIMNIPDNTNTFVLNYVNDYIPSLKWLVNHLIL